MAHKAEREWFVATQATMTCLMALAWMWALQCPHPSPTPFRFAARPTASNAIKEQRGDYRRIADVVGYFCSGDK